MIYGYNKMLHVQKKKKKTEPWYAVLGHTHKRSENSTFMTSLLHLHDGISRHTLNPLSVNVLPWCLQHLNGRLIFSALVFTRQKLTCAKIIQHVLTIPLLKK